MSTEDLRTPLIRSLEDAATRLAVGEYGDPHVGFLVLVHADQAPTIVLITDAGSPHSVNRIQFTDDMSEDEKDRRERRERREGRKHFFSIQDLNDAYKALSDAHFAMRWTHSRKEGEGVGVAVARIVAFRWDERRIHSMNAALEAAKDAARRAAQCPHCHSRYTVRGLKTHLQRAPWCSKQEAAARAADTEASPT